MLRIILAGQPELNDKLNSPMLIQLAQRIRLRFHLTALSKTDTRAVHPAPPGSRRLAGAADLRSRDVSADVPLHRRHSAPGQHAVRHLDDGRVRAGPRRRHGRGHARGDRRAAVGRVRRALGQAAGALVRTRRSRQLPHSARRRASGASCSAASWSASTARRSRSAS